MLGCGLSDAHDINVTPRALIKCASSSQTFLYRSFRKRRTIDEITQWETYAEAALRVGVRHPRFLAGVDRGPSEIRRDSLVGLGTTKANTGIRQVVGHTPAQMFASRRTTCVLIPISATMVRLRTGKIDNPGEVTSCSCKGAARGRVNFHLEYSPQPGAVSVSAHPRLNAEQRRLICFYD